MFGFVEGFYGEVDDVIAARDYLAGLPHVDPNRIYLGGHSTGGTLALLVSESTDKFRAVFSFGPAHDVSGYGGELLPITVNDPKEIKLRSPVHWLHSIQSPTFVIEGTVDGNLGALRRLEQASKNPKVQFLPVRGADHFSVLAPVNQVLAQKILADTGPTCGITLDAGDIR